jgi:N-dimethylarginine dimethylaminohydrolase
MDGVKQCMVNNWFGTNKVCIVHCPIEIPLRCYFGMVNSKTVLLWKGAMDFKVDEWSDSIKTHEFIRIRTAVSLYAYLTLLGYKVLLISDESYTNMGCNVMYVNDHTVLTQDDDVTMLISKKCRDVNAICIEYDEIKNICSSYSSGGGGSTEGLVAERRPAKRGRQAPA